MKRGTLVAEGGDQETGLNRSDDSQTRAMGKRAPPKEKTVNRVSHEPSPAFSTPSTGTLPRIVEAVRKPGGFRMEPVRPVLSRVPEEKPPRALSSQARYPLLLPVPSPPSSLRPLEQRKVTFVSTRSRLSNEEPRRLHELRQDSNSLKYSQHALSQSVRLCDCRFYEVYIL